ncbi:SAM-dependent methyltransferase, partial [Streptomyces caniscabiei]|nr:SAM-dependent methyltransferase [Streptomyces caniscabiei]
MTRDPETRYLLDNQRSEAGERFVALSRLFDASTFRHVDDLGIAAGWRCWEVGA